MINTTYIILFEETMYNNVQIKNLICQKLKKDKLDEFPTLLTWLIMTVWDSTTTETMSCEFLRHGHFLANCFPQKMNFLHWLSRYHWGGRCEARGKWTHIKNLDLWYRGWDTSGGDWTRRNDHRNCRQETLSAQNRRISLWVSVRPCRRKNSSHSWHTDVCFRVWNIQSR